MRVNALDIDDALRRPFHFDTLLLPDGDVLVLNVCDDAVAADIEHSERHDPVCVLKGPLDIFRRTPMRSLDDGLPLRQNTGRRRVCVAERIQPCSRDDPHR